MKQHIKQNREEKESNTVQANGSSNSSNSEQISLMESQSQPTKFDMESQLAQLQQKYLLNVLPEIHHQVQINISHESSWDEEQPVFSSVTDWFTDNDKPNIQRWNHVLSNINRAQDLIAKGNIEHGLITYREAKRWFVKYNREFTTYIRATASDLDTLHSDMELTRDIALSVGVGGLGVMAAPVVAPMVFGTSVGTAGTVLVGSVITGTGVAVSRGSGNMLGQLIFIGDVDWHEASHESWEGFKSGLIDGGLGVLASAPATAKLIGLDPGTLAKQTGGWLQRAFSQAMKEGAKEATLSSLQTMLHKCADLATSESLRQEWSRNPDKAWHDFSTELLSAGLSGFVGGSFTGGHDAITTKAGTKRGQLGSMTKGVKNAGSRAITQMNVSLNPEVKEMLVNAFPDLSSQVLGRLTAALVEQQRSGTELDEEWFQNQFKEMGISNVLNGPAGGKSKATQLAWILQKLNR